MLKANKSISLTGNSMINDKHVVYMQATVATDGGGTSRNNNIQEKVLYESHKQECRRDMADFDKMVYEIEDSLTPPTEEVR